MTHAATVQQLGAELTRLASSSPQMFTEGFGGSPLPESALRLAGTSGFVELRLGFAPPAGVTASSVRVSVLRTAAGDLRISALTADPAQVSQAAPYVPPANVAAVAEAMRLRIMDSACQLPTLTSAEAIEVFGVSDTFSQDRATQAGGNCAAAAAAFAATTLTVASSSVFVSWPQSSGPGALMYLSGDLSSGGTVAFTQTSYALRH